MMGFRNMMFIRLGMVVSVLLLATALPGCISLSTASGPLSAPSPAPLAGQPGQLFVPASVSDYQGWSKAQAVGLSRALQESCKVYAKRTGQVSDNPLFGTYEQWHPLCTRLSQLEDHALQSFFESHFAVYQVAPEEKGLFTGYFTPLLHGSRVRSQRYSTPLLKVPEDLVQLNPKKFGLKNSNDQRLNKMLAAKLNDGWMVPYDNRAGINERVWRGEYKNDVLLWVDDRVDRFFLQIQGSGTVRLDTGEDVQVGFAGRNGHDYFAIGRYMKQKGLLEEVSMQSIRQWLDKNPDRLDEVLHTNPDFIFFAESEKLGPVGAQGSRLIPEHSAAVNRSVIPLGTPLWVNTTLTRNNTPFARAMVAQDVGSAIRGNVRVDVFFGAGAEAGDKAGYQNADGKLYVMVPR